MPLFLPPSVSRELRERTQSFNAAVRASVYDFDPHDSVLADFNPVLQQIDPRLLMVRARERIVPGLPMKPGYYHIICDNSDRGAPDTVMIVEGEHGEFTPPTSRVFEKLAAGDMHDRRNVERFERIQREERERNEREQRANREERREHLSELVNAYTRASVAGPGAGLWTQNQAGRRDAGERKKRRG
jgi:hypothetical protein